MKLHRGCDVSLDGIGLVCRQTRLGGLAMALLISTVLLSFPVALWWFQIPWLFVVPAALFSLLVVGFFISDVRARFRPTNWVLWIRPDAIWVNLRSYQDHNPLDSPSVVELADRDIACLRRHVERYSVSDSEGRPVSHKLESLDFELRQPDTSELAAALAEIRHRRQPEVEYLAGIRGRSGVTLYSVSLPQPNLLRIAWHGGQGHAVTPRLRRVLAELANRVTIDEPTQHQTPDASQIDEGELDAQILSLVEAGNHIDAIKLLVQRHGYTLTEAKRFVDELANRA